jgi:hypothetical protein
MTFDSYTLPVLDDAVSALARTQYFFVLDRNSGSWQVEIWETNKEYCQGLTNVTDFLSVYPTAQLHMTALPKLHQQD